LVNGSKDSTSKKEEDISHYDTLCVAPIAHASVRGIVALKRIGLLNQMTCQLTIY